MDFRRNAVHFIKLIQKPSNHFLLHFYFLKLVQGLAVISATYFLTTGLWMSLIRLDGFNFFMGSFLQALFPVIYFYLAHIASKYIQKNNEIGLLLGLFLSALLFTAKLWPLGLLGFYVFLNPSFQKKYFFQNSSSVFENLSKLGLDFRFKS